MTLGVPAGSVAVTVKDGATAGAGRDAHAHRPERLLGHRHDRRHRHLHVRERRHRQRLLASSRPKGAATASQGSITVSTGATTVNLSMTSVGTIKVTVTDGTNPISACP